MGYVRPDFGLSCADPRVPAVAVFCDGRKFHATAEHNRLADDAEKRAALRAEDYVVWAVTHNDLDAFEQVLDGTPSAGYPYLGGAQRAALEKLGNHPDFFGPRTLAAARLQGDAVSLLTAFLLRPDRDAWLGPARALALGLTGGTRDGVSTVDPGALPDLLARELRGERARKSKGATRVAVRRSGGGAVALVDVSTKDFRVLLGVDDRAETIAGPEVEQSWRDWLALSNLLQFLGDGRFTAGTTTLPVPGDLPAAPTAPTIDAAWRALVKARFGGAVDALIAELAGRGIPAPEPGHETRDGEYVIDLAWVALRIAVAVGEDADRDAALLADGWTVVAARADDVVNALEGIS